MITAATLIMIFICAFVIFRVYEKMSMMEEVYERSKEPSEEVKAEKRKEKLKKLVNEMGPEIYEVFETINNKNHV